MANGTLKVSNIETSSGSGTITIGQSGETVDMANGSITLNSGMKATPAFHVTLSSNQSISGNTWTKLQLDSESFDSDNCYDNSTNYRFTPTVAGKYFCYGTYYSLQSSGDDVLIQCRILKNGDTAEGTQETSNRVTTSDVLSISGHSTVTLNGSSDYVEFWVYQNEYNAGGAFNARGNSSGRQFCNFGAYRIIGA